MEIAILIAQKGLRILRHLLQNCQEPGNNLLTVGSSFVQGNPRHLRVISVELQWVAEWIPAFAGMMALGIPLGSQMTPLPKKGVDSKIAPVLFLPTDWSVPVPSWSLRVKLWARLFPVLKFCSKA